MDVRLARPTDAPLVLALTLDERAHLVRSPDWPAARPILRSVARALLPVVAPGRTWIARDGKSCALVEARPRRYVIGWDITRLAVRGDRSTVLPAAVDAVNRHLQNRSVPRLFARCREEGRAELEELGFRALSREYILVGAPSDLVGSELPADSRYRMPQDAWPLHQLESAVTPPLVRQLEGLTSLEWSQGARGVSEIVVESEGRVVGWIGWSRAGAPRTFTVGLLVHPDHDELGCSLLGHVVEQAGPEARFLARVRDYQPESLNALLAAGFEIVGEEVLMVRHGRVALAPAERTRLRVARVPSIPAMPFRVVISGPRGGTTKESSL
jgi:hypothetical protein